MAGTRAKLPGLSGVNRLKLALSPVDASKTRRFCVPAASSGSNRTFSSIRPRGALTKLIGAVADIVWRRNVRAKIALVVLRPRRARFCTKVDG